MSDVLRVSLTNPEGKKMRITSLALGVSIAVFGWQSCVQAQAACQNMDAAICGPGNGVFSSVSGDIVLGRGGGISPAMAGTSVLAGDRILVRSGAVAVNLGPNCTASVAAGSVATVTQQKNLTCLNGNVLPQTVGADLPTHKEPPAPMMPEPVPVAQQGPVDPLLIVGIAAVGAGAIACAIWCFEHHNNGNFVSP
jgi:hypothetical protein